MISYESYKFLHLFFIFILLSSLGFISGSTEFIQKSTSKIILGVISFLILVAGMGLIARLGFKHSEPFPLWIKLKMINWVILNVAVILLFKITKNIHKAALLAFIVLISAMSIWIAINKPL